MTNNQHTYLVEVDFHSSHTAQARDMDIHSRLPGCTGEFQTHPEREILVRVQQNFKITIIVTMTFPIHFL